MAEQPGAAGAVKSADRTLSILELLATASRRQSLGEISTALDIPKSSLHGLLRTLRSRGWVSVDESGTRFGVGMRALLVGVSFTGTDDMVGLTADVLDELVGQLDETVHMGCLDGDRIVYLAKREPSHPLRLVSAVGVRLPAASTALGKMLLAERPAKIVQDLLPAKLPALTPSTITSRADLLASFREINERCYAVDDEESTAGVRCFAVAVGPRFPSDYAISTSIPTARLDAQREKHVIEVLLQARARLIDRHALNGPN